MLLRKMSLTSFLFVYSVSSRFSLLYRGSMFVVSKAQFQKLLGLQEDQKLDTLLDLGKNLLHATVPLHTSIFICFRITGAGDGNTTLEISSFFREIHATEVSPVMRWRLRQHGFKCVKMCYYSMFVR